MSGNISWLGRGVCAAVVCVHLVSFAWADSFGSGANQFSIDFVTISGDASSLNGTNVSQYSQGDPYYKSFCDLSNQYRIGIYEVTNYQWNMFKSELGVPITGTPLSAYEEGPVWTGAQVPINNVSWYEAAQFVNWLNVSTGHHEAYQFTGTQGTSDYTFAIWSTTDAANSENLYRHKDAFFFLPTEDEWIKAAYWNGATLQAHATRPPETLHQGDGTHGDGWNFYDGGYATDPYGPWNVGSGSEELNGTFDMMGNVREWLESPYTEGDFADDGIRGLRDGSYGLDEYNLSSSIRGRTCPDDAYLGIGFRVASQVPEPATLSLLAMGGVAVLRLRK